MRPFIFLLTLLFSVCVFPAAGGSVADNPVCIEPKPPDAEVSVAATENQAETGDKSEVIVVYSTAPLPPETFLAENPLKSLDGIFATFFTLAAFIPVAFQFIRKTLFPTARGFGVQALSWIAGILITVAGWFFNLGFLEGLSLWMALLYGAGASLAANGVYDTGLINAVFDALFNFNA